MPSDVIKPLAELLKQMGYQECVLSDRILYQNNTFMIGSKVCAVIQTNPLKTPVMETKRVGKSIYMATDEYAKRGRRLSYDFKDVESAKPEELALSIFLRTPGETSQDVFRETASAFGFPVFQDDSTNGVLTGAFYIKDLGRLSEFNQKYDESLQERFRKHRQRENNTTPCIIKKVEELIKPICPSIHTFADCPQQEET